MFKRLPDLAPRESVEIIVDGVCLKAYEGDTVAAAMLAADVSMFHCAPFSRAPRGPYCMMGVCFDCLVMIEGVGNQQACQRLVAPGMRIVTGAGRRGIE